MPYDPQLAEHIRRALRGRPGISEKAMFGGICWLLNGNMLCGVAVGRFMFRVGRDREAEALSRPGAEVVVLGGRRMGGFVWVGTGACGGAELDRWLEFAAGYVGGLPPK